MFPPTPNLARPSCDPKLSVRPPAEIGSVELRNLIVMAPLTRSRAAADAVPSDLNTRYYAQRAPADLIISEATQISPQGKCYPKTPGIYNCKQIAGWQEVTKAVHEQGGTILFSFGTLAANRLQPPRPRAALQLAQQHKELVSHFSNSFMFQMQRASGS